MSVDTVYRSCPTCEASCGLVLEVDRDQRQVLSVKGDPDDPRSLGYVCAKSQAFRYVFEDPERLRRPLKRVGDGWQELDWEVALGEIGERLAAIRAEHGKDAIAMYYGNPNGHNFATQIYTQLFIGMLDTQRFFSAGSVDQQPKNLSCELLYGNAWTFPIPDIDRTDFFVCMGGNPLVSQGSLMSAPDMAGRLAAIRQRGGRVVVIDPRRSETAEAADQHLFIRPGSDAFLLFAWVNTLFEQGLVSPGHLAGFTDGIDAVRELARPFTPEAVAAVTGVDPGVLRRLVADFSAAQAPVVYGRIGLCTQRFGTLASWLVDVVNILTGRLDAPGGAMFPRPATGHNEPTGEVQPLAHGRWHSRVRGFPEYMGMLPASLMAEELEYAGPDRARALITVAGNPVLSVPNGQRLRGAMRGLDLVVALDIYVNETTSLADYILPSTVQLEHSNYDFLFTTTCVRNFARYSPGVFEPEAGALHQWQLMTDLVARINGMAGDDLAAMMVDGLAAQVAAGSGVDVDRVKAASAAFDGPERLLDIMLRAGPYGSGFGPGGEEDGLNLSRLKAAEHGVDLGPLQPWLPQMLRTPGQRISLVHPLIAQDVERLRTALAEGPAAGFLLIGRRHIRDMNSWLHNIEQYARGRNRCTLLMHPEDALRLGIDHGGTARVVSRVGEQVVEVSVSDEIMPGVVSLPHGFGHRYAGTRQSVARSRAPGVSANDLVDDTELDLPSGTSVVNGVPVQVYAV